MDKVKIGMLGCGAVANLYMPVFKYLEEGEIKAVVDIKENVALEIAEKYGVKKSTQM